MLHTLCVNEGKGEGRRGEGRGYCAFALHSLLLTCPFDLAPPSRKCIL